VLLTCDAMAIGWGVRVS